MIELVNSAEHMVKRSSRGLLQLLWLITLALFPITSPPFIPLGNVVAKPLCFVPACLLLMLAFLTGSGRLKGLISVENAFLVIFGFIAVMTGILHWGFASSEMSIFGLNNYYRALPTLAIGMVFYITFRIMNLDRRELAISELVIMGAVTVSIGVEFLQLLADKFFTFLLPLVELINSLFVDVVGTWTERYHGLAYEPSWLADQLLLIALPLSLSRVLSGDSLGLVRMPLLGIRVRTEKFFLTMTMLGIFISGSRTAIFGALLILILTAVVYIVKSKKRLFTISNGINMILASAAGFIGIGYALSNDYVLSAVVAIYSASTMVELVQWASFGTRASVWFTTFQVFLENPVVGVGLGGAELYYSEYVPDWILDSPEAQSWLGGGRANSKNIILRVLAETGVIGGLIFFSFVLLHFRGRGNVRHLYLKISTAVAVIVTSFQSDTFALPTLWFALGFLLLNGRLLPDSDDKKNLDRVVGNRWGQQ